MESTRVVMLVTMMIVVVMGNLLNQTEATDDDVPFYFCYPACVTRCGSESKFPKSVKCPSKCVKTCLQQPSLESGSSLNVDDDTDYFCKLGCATQHCVPLSSLRNPNAEKVSACVDSCSNKCSNKY